jgi:hypothetical protein
VKRAFYTVLQNRKRHLQSEKLTKWHKETHKALKIKRDYEQSMKIYRHRFLSKYLSVWLRELHGQLKEKHLNAICDTY